MRSGLALDRGGAHRSVERRRSWRPTGDLRHLEDMAPRRRGVVISSTDAGLTYELQQARERKRSALLCLTRQAIALSRLTHSCPVGHACRIRPLHALIASRQVDHQSISRRSHFEIRLECTPVLRTRPRIFGGRVLAWKGPSRCCAEFPASSDRSSGGNYFCRTNGHTTYPTPCCSSTADGGIYVMVEARRWSRAWTPLSFPLWRGMRYGSVECVEPTTNLSSATTEQANPLRKAGPVLQKQAEEPTHLAGTSEGRITAFSGLRPRRTWPSQPQPELGQITQQSIWSNPGHTPLEGTALHPSDKNYQDAECNLYAKTLGEVLFLSNPTVEDLTQHHLWVPIVLSPGCPRTRPRPNDDHPRHSTLSFVLLLRHRAFMTRIPGDARGLPRLSWLLYRSSPTALGPCEMVQGQAGSGHGCRLSPLACRRRDLKQIRWRCLELNTIVGTGSRFLGWALAVRLGRGGSGVRIFCSLAHSSLVFPTNMGRVAILVPQVSPISLVHRGSEVYASCYFYIGIFTLPDQSSGA